MNDDQLRQCLAPLKQVTPAPVAAQQSARKLALASYRAGDRSQDSLSGESRWTWRGLFWPLAWAACALAIIATPEPFRSRQNAPQTPGPTQITSTEATTDQKTRESVFTGDVMLRTPGFTIACDRLRVTTNAPADASTAPSGTVSSSVAFKRAVAEAANGKTVTITQKKIEPDGSTTTIVGRSAQATYDASTGEFVLTGNPSVQQGNSRCVATAENTVMTIDRNGKLRATGPHRNTIADAQPGSSPR